MLGRVLMGRYELKRLLGEGGMGKVFLAREFNHDRYVVVKVMHEHLVADAKSRERFLRETELMGRFRHPNMVNLMDAVIDDSCGPCIIMEYIPGIGLDALLAKNKRFTPARVGRFLEQLCDVLQGAHERGIIHRDLKPHNLMVMQPDTPQERIKVMDFGLAKICHNEEAGQERKLTDPGKDFAVGTPSYIAPEQVRGEPVDHRSDLYSVGVIAYELLSGRLPFLCSSPMDMMLAHATETPPSFAELELRDWVPPAVEEVVFACLEKEPDKRPMSAHDLFERYTAALAAAEVVDVLPVEEPVDPLRGTEVALGALMFEIDAWMPQEIARIKLRGFVHDCGGRILESEPGRILVRLNNYAARTAPRGFSWFKSYRSAESDDSGFDAELLLEQRDAQRENKLHITVLFRPAYQTSVHDLAWQDRCRQTFCDIRSYLMGH
ncbi:MAG TPA: serine/threonine-protein kinase [Gemmataceae bacterium]|jgi:serine/threonine-protein kinase|nr:serine/threonine-protein kinase [Gemmataceae bacterium]